MTNEFSLNLHWGNTSSLSMFSCFHDTLHHSHYNGQRLLWFVRWQLGCRNHKWDKYNCYRAKSIWDTWKPQLRTYSNFDNDDMVSFSMIPSWSDSLSFSAHHCFQIVFPLRRYCRYCRYCHSHRHLRLHRSLDRPFLVLVNRLKSSCFLLNACQLLTLPDHPGRY